MNNRCPQDGGFIGDAGCTHPNHQHSELVKGLLAAKEPGMMDVSAARGALQEGFYVEAPGGRVGFGQKLLDHITAGHAAADAKGRLERLHFAVDTVKLPDRVEVGHRGFPGRTAYFKSYSDFGIVAVSERGTGNIDYMFNSPRTCRQKKVCHPLNTTDGTITIQPKPQGFVK